MQCKSYASYLRLTSAIKQLLSSACECEVFKMFISQTLFNLRLMNIDKVKTPSLYQQTKQNQSDKVIKQLSNQTSKLRGI